MQVENMFLSLTLDTLIGLFLQKFGFEKSGFLATVLLEPGLISVITTHNKILKACHFGKTVYYKN